MFKSNRELPCVTWYTGVILQQERGIVGGTLPDSKRTPCFEKQSSVLKITLQQIDGCRLCWHAMACWGYKTRQFVEKNRLNSLSTLATHKEILYLGVRPLFVLLVKSPLVLKPQSCGLSYFRFCNSCRYIILVKNDKNYNMLYYEPNLGFYLFVNCFN